MSAGAKSRAPELDRERGLTLIEVMVAFFILFVVTIAVLQMLSMAYLVNMGSLIRSDLTYRAERVVETVRTERFLVFTAGKTASACCPVTASATAYTLPDPSDVPCYAYWGPAGANVVEPNARFVLAYSIQTTDGGDQLTVHATPQASGPNMYLVPAATKEVVYVARF